MQDEVLKIRIDDLERNEGSNRKKLYNMWFLWPVRGLATHFNDGIFQQEPSLFNGKKMIES